MKIRLRNLGAIRQAEFQLGRLTIICGSNNTGKTYATYALYGFLDFWHKRFNLTVHSKYIETLLNQGFVSIDIKDFAQKAQEILETASIEYSAKLAEVFSSQKKIFEDSKFEILLDKSDIKLKSEVFEQKIRPSASNADIFMLRMEITS